MKINRLIGSILVELILIGAIPRLAQAYNSLEQLNGISQSTALTNEKKVLELAKLLDLRLSSPTVSASTNAADDSGRDIAQLVGYIAYLYYPIKTTPTAPAISRLLEPGALAGFRNAKQVKNHLYVALGLARGQPPEDVMLGFLKDSGTSDLMLNMTLRSMATSGVPIRAIPQLLRFEQHSWNYIQHDDVGPSRTRRVFPIRTAATECLKTLGIEVQVTFTKETPSGWTVPVSVAHFSVNNDSLAKKLEQWILNDRESIWRPALETAVVLSEPEVARMLRALKGTKGFPNTKKELLK